MTSPSSGRTVALVTGASSGIGAAFADALARQGHDLILVARRAERLTQAAEQLRSEFGVEVEALPADLANPGDLDRVRRRLVDEPDLALLVNNAGIGEIRPFTEMTSAEIDGLVALNVTALTQLAHAAMPRLQATGGALINVASAAALAAMAGAAVYGATKAYVVHFTRALREEPGLAAVRMQALIPGLTRTNLGGAESSGFFDRFPAELVMSPEDLVQASLAGLDLGELVCIPALEGPEQWERLYAELQALGSNASSSRTASRFRGPTA